jgi:hypothetical protein
MPGRKKVPPDLIGTKKLAALWAGKSIFGAREV